MLTHVAFKGSQKKKDGAQKQQVDPLRAKKIEPVNPSPRFKVVPIAGGGGGGTTNGRAFGAGGNKMRKSQVHRNMVRIEQNVADAISAYDAEHRASAATSRSRLAARIEKKKSKLAALTELAPSTSLVETKKKKKKSTVAADDADAVDSAVDGEKKAEEKAKAQQKAEKKAEKKAQKKAEKKAEKKTKRKAEKKARRKAEKQARKQAAKKKKKKKTSKEAEGEHGELHVKHAHESGQSLAVQRSLSRVASQRRKSRSKERFALAKQVNEGNSAHHL